MRRIALLLAGLSTTLCVLATPAVAANQSVGVRDDFFDRSKVAVKPGESVTWNHPATGEPHNVHFDDGPFTDPATPLASPWTATRTFANAGTYSYYCQNHGLNMSGTVYVNDLGDVPPAATFSAGPNPAQTGEKVDFNASGSNDADGTIATFKWDLDGQPGFEVNTGTTPTVSRAYTSAGTLTVKVQVTDNLGLTAEDSKLLQINAGAPPPPPPPAPTSPPPASSTVTNPMAPASLADTTGPSVSDYGMSNKAFQAGKASTPTTGQAAKKAATGTTFRYKLSEPATVKIDLQQLLPGRKKGKACVKPTAKLGKAKKCLRAVSQGTLTRASHAGANTVPFSGRIGTRSLRPGGYQAVLTAIDGAGNGSGRKTLSFKVVRG